MTSGRRADGPHLSIIVPVLNEADTIASTLQALAPLRKRGHEVIVVDGGSMDGTRPRIRVLADQALDSVRGRAMQMNAGARVATGEVLVFLHADTRLPPDADRSIAEGLARTGRAWGRFDVRLSGAAAGLRVIEFFMNLRSRLTGIATGDQAIFVRREDFESVGGFPAVDLMEDIALSALLKRVSRPACLRERVVTSSRKWEREGIVRTVLLMWRLRLAYCFGANPRDLARRYYGRQEQSG